MKTIGKIVLGLIMLALAGCGTVPPSSPAPSAPANPAPASNAGTPEVSIPPTPLQKQLRYADLKQWFSDNQRIEVVDDPAYLGNPCAMGGDNNFPADEQPMEEHHYLALVVFTVSEECSSDFLKEGIAQTERFFGSLGRDGYTIAGPNWVVFTGYFYSAREILETFGGNATTVTKPTPTQTRANTGRSEFMGRTCDQFFQGKEGIIAKNPKDQVPVEIAEEGESKAITWCTYDTSGEEDAQGAFDVYSNASKDCRPDSNWDDATPGMISMGWKAMINRQVGVSTMLQMCNEQYWLRINWYQTPEPTEEQMAAAALWIVQP